jgi:hypothetical protein
MCPFETQFISNSTPRPCPRIKDLAKGTKKKPPSVSWQKWSIPCSHGSSAKSSWRRLLSSYVYVHHHLSIFEHPSVTWLTYFVVAIQFRSILIDLFKNHLHTLVWTTIHSWFEFTCKWHFLSMMVHMVKHTNNQIYKAELYISTSSTPIQKRIPNLTLRFPLDEPSSK